MTTETNKVSFPTAFKVFTQGHTLDEKRFMKKVCDVVEASTGLKAHSKWNTLAGSRAVQGKEITIPGFNVLMECSSKEDRQRVRRLFWTQETLLSDGDFDTVTIPSHSKSCGVDDVNETDPVLLVAGLLGIENTVVPSEWAEKLQKNQTREMEKAEKKQLRDAKKLIAAVKRADAQAALELKRAQKKSMTVTQPEAPAAEAPVLVSDDAAPVEPVEA